MGGGGGRGRGEGGTRLTAHTYILYEMRHVVESNHNHTHLQ